MLSEGEKTAVYTELTKKISLEKDTGKTSQSLERPNPSSPGSSPTNNRKNSHGQRLVEKMCQKEMCKDLNILCI